MMIDYTGISVFEENDTTRLISKSAKDFSKKYILPNVMKWDESQSVSYTHLTLPTKA